MPPPWRPEEEGQELPPSWRWESTVTSVISRHAIWIVRLLSWCANNLSISVWVLTIHINSTYSFSKKKTIGQETKKAISQLPSFNKWRNDWFASDVQKFILVYYQNALLIAPRFPKPTSRLVQWSLIQINQIWPNDLSKLVANKSKTGRKGSMI